MTTHVIWDWNGTLFDDVQVCLDSINQVLDEFDLPTLANVAAYQRVFRFPIADYYADLGFEMGPGGNFDAAAHRFIEVYHARSEACALHEGATDVLELLAEQGLRQVVISASEQGNLDRQLRPFALDRWLDDARGIADIYARSKEHLVRSFVEQVGGPAGVVMIGDTEHDHEIAQSVGVRCLLVAKGHHTAAHLATLGSPVLTHVGEVPGLLA